MDKSSDKAQKISTHLQPGNCQFKYDLQILPIYVRDHGNNQVHHEMPV